MPGEKGSCEGDGEGGHGPSVFQQKMIDFAKKLPTFGHGKAPPDLFVQSEVAIVESAIEGGWKVPKLGPGYEYLKDYQDQDHWHYTEEQLASAAKFLGLE